jgi:hypothetical protein
MIGGEMMTCSKANVCGWPVIMRMPLLCWRNAMWLHPGVLSIFWPLYAADPSWSSWYPPSAVRPKQSAAQADVRRAVCESAWIGFGDGSLTSHVVAWIEARSGASGVVEVAGWPAAMGA